MFAAEYQATDASRRRCSNRAPVTLDASVARDGLARTLCKVLDVSIHGARIQSYSLLVKGGTILLTLPGIGAVAADVRWADDYVAGCQFHRPLDPIAFEGLLGRANGGLA